MYIVFISHVCQMKIINIISSGGGGDYPGLCVCV